MTEQSIPQPLFEQQPATTPWLERKLFWKVTPAILLLTLILLVSIFLHLYNLEAIGDANQYYTAAVESMLDSWSNFFFVAAEPGGSVTVDKPPLGLWIEAGFAYLFGVSGVVVSLPNILAGILSIPVLYHLVKRYLGAAPALVAAAVFAVTPVMLAADRNNTMDSMLVFTLLLAAWAFILAAERGKLGYLLLGGLIVGLGFNIKMLQAFLPLPAFFAFYFLVSGEKVWRKLLNLGLTSIVILAVSLSWALAVDAVPEDQRPYIGSSTDNTVMELIVGHNGLNRLFGGGGSRAQTTPQNDDGPLALQGQPGEFPQGQTRPNAGQQPPNQGNFPPDDGRAPGAPDGANQPANRSGGQFSEEIGQAGVLRLFEPQLANEIGWLLPMGLVSLLAAVFTAKIKFPAIANAHKMGVLWGGWLLTCVVFFSVAEFFHAYYMVMLAPALAASVGLGWFVFDHWRREKPWGAALGWLAAAGLTLALQVHLLRVYGTSGVYLPLAVGLFVVGVGLVLFQAYRAGQGNDLRSPGYGVVLGAVLLIPLVWSFLTVASDSPNVNLPSAYAGESGERGNGQRPQVIGAENSQDDKLVSYLLAHQTGKYLVAVQSANQGDSIVLATGEPVLFMGGFNGGDQVVDAADLAELVAQGDLTYIMTGGQDRGGQSEINQWVQASCTLVTDLNTNSRQARPGQNVVELYQCAP